MHQRHFTQTFACISRTVEGQPGHSRLQESMRDEDELDCAPSKRKTINWTPLAWLNSLLGHPTGFSTSEDFNKEKVQQDWTSFNCQNLALRILHLIEQTSRMPLQTLRYRRSRRPPPDDSCTQHAGATMGAHEDILTALQRLFTKAGYRTDRKNLPHSRD